MFEFFDWVVNIVTSLVNFVISLINGLLTLLQIAPLALEYLTNSLGLVPSIFLGFATATITVSIVFLIVGRQGGGEK